jgi:hypothetical protein
MGLAHAESGLKRILCSCSSLRYGCRHSLIMWERNRRIFELEELPPSRVAMLLIFLLRQGQMVTRGCASADFWGVSWLAYFRVGFCAGWSLAGCLRPLLRLLTNQFLPPSLRYCMIADQRLILVETSAGLASRSRCKQHETAEKFPTTPRGSCLLLIPISQSAAEATHPFI